MNKKLQITLFISATLSLILYACAQQQPSTPTGGVVQKPLPEETLAVAVSFTDFPLTAEKESLIQISWRVDSSAAATAVHTAVHYDTQSHPGDFGTDIGPQDSGYPTFTQKYAAGSFPVPAEFSDTIRVPAGSNKLYIRAHAIIDGKNYWTGERAIAISEASQASQTAEYSIEADDDGLYPQTITVKKGDTVRITFMVSGENVYYGGLEFRSDVWGTTGKVAPGESKTVEFVAEQSFDYKSYWPASNVLKETGRVVIE